MASSVTRRTLLQHAVAASAVGALGTPARSGEQELPATIRVGIIGLDGHVSEITGTLKTVPGLRISAVSESKPELAQRAKKSAAYAQATFYQDYRQLLEREQLDVVAVCGETGGRAAILQACAERKLPIVSEKPLTLTLEELKAVRKAIAEHRVPLTLLLPMRFSPHYAAMRRIVRRGAIGEVVGINAQKSYQLGSRAEWMRHRNRLGGTIPYVGIHTVDLMLWISGRKFTEVSAFHANVGAPELGETENTAAALFRMENRGTASLQLDYLRPATAPSHGDDRLRLTGSRGVVEYQAATGLTLITGDQPPRTVTDLPPERSLLVDFLEALYLGKAHLIRPEECFLHTEVVLKARAAADAGRVVKL